jgi:hypothetical protein
MTDHIPEPRVIDATVLATCDADGYPCFDIECRFQDGKKFAAVRVDNEFPELAYLIAELLNKEWRGPQLDELTRPNNKL